MHRKMTGKGEARIFFSFDTEHKVILPSNKKLPPSLLFFLKIPSHTKYIFPNYMQKLFSCSLTTLNPYIGPFLNMSKFFSLKLRDPLCKDLIQFLDLFPNRHYQECNYTSMLVCRSLEITVWNKLPDHFINIIVILPQFRAMHGAKVNTQ